MLGQFPSSLNSDILERSSIPTPSAPPESIQDKIHFIMNNVTRVNVKLKAKELKPILKTEYHPYFSRYLVVKRGFYFIFFCFFCFLFFHF